MTLKRFIVGGTWFYSIKEINEDTGTVFINIEVTFIGAITTNNLHTWDYFSFK